MKECKTCLTNKSTSDFYKSKKYKDGFFSECKVCHKIKVEERFKKNPETLKKRKEYQKEYRVINQEKLKKHKKDYYISNINSFKKKGKQYREENKESISIQKSNWVKKNKKKVYDNHKKWVSENREKIKQYAKTYRDKPESKAKSTYHANMRRLEKSKATPEWVNKDKIKVLYEKAKWLEGLTGLKYHVDHIVPLKGKNVCGLHCWENLQILEASLNCAKGNRHG